MFYQSRLHRSCVIDYGLLWAIQPMSSIDHIREQY